MNSTIVTILGQSAAFLFLAGMAWADLKGRLGRVEDEVKKINGRVTHLETKQAAGRGDTPSL